MRKLLPYDATSNTCNTIQKGKQEDFFFFLFFGKVNHPSPTFIILICDHPLSLKIFYDEIPAQKEYIPGRLNFYRFLTIQAFCYCKDRKRICSCFRVKHRKSDNIIRRYSLLHWFPDFHCQGGNRVLSRLADTHKMCRNHLEHQHPPCCCLEF